MEAFYTHHKGAVISTSINKYMYISSHKFFEEDKIRVKYSKTETVSQSDDLQHPILRTVLKKFGVKGGLEISSIADVPAGTGLGSSSAFTVGVLHNLHLIKKNTVNKIALDRKSTRLNSSHPSISYAVFCLKKKKKKKKNIHNKHNMINKQ